MPRPLVVFTVQERVPEIGEVVYLLNHYPDSFAGQYVHLQEYNPQRRFEHEPPYPTPMKAWKYQQGACIKINPTDTYIALGPNLPKRKTEPVRRYDLENIV